VLAVALAFAAPWSARADQPNGDPADATELGAEAPVFAEQPRQFLGGEIIDRTAPIADVVLDVVPIRPLRIIRVPMGFGIFLASLPMYIVAWDVPTAWDFLVDAPFEEAFLTPLGRI
jgi:hypothetical protein